MSHAVLIVDDEATLARNLAAYLERNGFDARVAGSGEEGLAQFAEFKPDIVLLDHNLPGLTGLEVLERLQKGDTQVPVIMMTGFGGIEVAVQALKLGAADYLTKPVSLGELKLLIQRLLEHNRLERTVGYYRQRDAEASGLDKIIGRSGAMQTLRDQITRLLEAESQLTDTDAPAVLIHGETGVGKELVARALHFGGPRRAMPFVELNCGAMPANLVEAELFGYEKGAFTDARQRKPGLVETAEGGTLFLDEIGEADPSTQVKLLKLLEDKRFRRLGGLRDQAVNVRVVSATHRSLDQMVRDKAFRADLLFRLRIIEIKVPALRERGDDVVDLARHFLQHHAQRYRRGDMSLTPDAEAALRRHAWPGNVRELRNVMEQAVLMSAGGRIAARDLPMQGVDLSAHADTPQWSDADLNLERMERHLIELALGRTQHNVTQAAKLLGVSRDTLRYRLERLGFKSGNTNE
ncbi:MAG: sigma-54 dependent transcriptional regulator [Rubrivivax sp.]